MLGKRGLGASGLPTGQAEILSRGPGEEAERLENLEVEQTAHWDLEVEETIQRGRGQARSECRSTGKWGEGGVGNAVRGIRSGKPVKSSSGLRL